MTEPLTPAQAEMLAANTGLVGYYLRCIRVPDDQWDDAFQDGLIGLARATQKFRPELGWRFSTYAMNWIRQAVQRGRGQMHGSNYRRAIAAGADYEAPLSLDRTYGMPGDDGEVTILDYLPAVDRPSALDDEVFANEGFDRLALTLRRHCRDAIDDLIVDQIIDEARGGEPLSLTKLAELIDLSRERIRQRKLMILKRARDELIGGAP